MTMPTKLIVFSCGGKGGVGKTTVATAIADFYAARAIPATLFDCDTENKQRGSLSHFFPDATPHRLFLPSADYAPAAAPTKENPNPRRTMVAGSFKILVLEP
jgi:hypothetical protein